MLRFVALGTRAIHDGMLRALAWGTGAGLLLELGWPGSALHPRWMGSTGSRAGDAALAAAFVLLVLVGPAQRAPWARLLVGGPVVLLTARSLVRHLVALGDGSLTATACVPPATLVALALLVPWVLGWARGSARPPPAPPYGLGTAGLLLGAGLLLAAQLAAVGATDYRGRADAILVLGARVHADGSLSGALADRTATAVDLWRGGLAPVLVLSGGRGADAPVSEPEAMARAARAAGVPDSALLLDEGGADTAASIAYLAREARVRGWRRVLVVSHDYHLARLRLLADRAGLEVRTVPARETTAWPSKPLAVAREAAALAASWALPFRTP